jgi:DHA1 family tetracycline resistance protein-like MFS transporter
MQYYNSALIFILTSILIDVIGLGIIIPVMPALIQELTGEGLSQASVYAGWMMFCYASAEFLFAPVMGALSDQFGRKKILVASLFGFALDYCFLAFAPSILLFFIGRIIAGILGASYTTGTAYIADISTSENKARNFGYIGVAFGVGFIIGPLMGGLLGSFGSRVPFYTAAAVSLINCLFGIFFVPESLPKSKRRKFDIRRANPIGTVLQLKKHPELISLMIAFFLYYLSGNAVHSTWTFFSIERLDWSETQIGISLGIIGLLVVIVNGFLITPVIKVFGINRAIIYSSILMGLGNLLFAFSTTTWMMYVFMLPYILGGICEPAIQSLVSNRVPDNEQGEIQGAMTALISLSSIIGPPVMTSLFSYFTSEKSGIYFPGAAFVLGALMTLVSTLMLIPALKKIKSKDKAVQPL